MTDSATVLPYRIDRNVHDGSTDDLNDRNGLLGIGYWSEETTRPSDAIVNLWRELLGLIPDKTGNVLALARETAILASRFPEYYSPTDVTGIDISDNMLAFGGPGSARNGLGQMDDLRQSHSDASFDNIVCVEALLSPDTREVFIRDAYRLLRPGGRLVLSDALVSGRCTQERQDETAVSYPSDLDEYAHIYRRFGFVDTSVMDTTEQCWRRWFWAYVNFVHARFLDGKIDANEKNDALEPVYRLADVLDHYVIVAARKPLAVESRVTRVDINNQDLSSTFAEHTSAETRSGRPDGSELACNGSVATFPVREHDAPHEGGYDTLMYWPALEAFYGHSDFVNYGYWDNTTTDARDACVKLVEKLLALIPDKTGTILDVACGKGATTRQVLKYYPASDVTGIDLSDKQLQRCRQNAPGVHFLTMDAIDLQFDDNSFDNMICVEAAFHFVTRQRFLREAFRVLKPGGRLVLCDLLLTREAEGKRRWGTVENYVGDLDQYERICSDAGFADATIIDVTEPCLKNGYWAFVRFAHEQLLTRSITSDGLKTFVRRYFGLVPHFRFYLLACLQKCSE